MRNRDDYFGFLDPQKACMLTSTCTYFDRSIRYLISDRSKYGRQKYDPDNGEDNEKDYISLGDRHS